jgi:hypothetical protein
LQNLAVSLVVDIGHDIALIGIVGGIQFDAVLVGILIVEIYRAFMEDIAIGTV